MPLQNKKAYSASFSFLFFLSSSCNCSTCAFKTAICWSFIAPISVNFWITSSASMLFNAHHPFNFLNARLLFPYNWYEESPQAVIHYPFGIVVLIKLHKLLQPRSHDVLRS